MIAEIDQRIGRALGRIRLALRVVLGNVNSAPGVQLADGSGLAGEEIKAAELMQHYGLTSRPPAGTQGVAIPLGGKTSHAVIVATEHASYRLLALETGEVALYTDEGAKIVLKRGKIIETDCEVFRVNCNVWEVNAAARADFNTPVLTASEQAVVNAQLTGKGGLSLSNANGGGATAAITGTMQVTQDVIAAGVSQVHHRHPVDAFGLTDEPSSANY